MGSIAALSRLTHLLSPRALAGDSLGADFEMATKAIWNGAVIAATDNYEVVEGNVYFPPASVSMEYVKPSATHTTCGASHSRV